MSIHPVTSLYNEKTLSCLWSRIACVILASKHLENRMGLVIASAYLPNQQVDNFFGEKNEHD